jgi:hypothetical protein
MRNQLLTTEACERELPVADWRYQQLLQAGWPDEQALLLAANPAVDLHRACDLLSAGCKPELAVRIVL